MPWRRHRCSSAERENERRPYVRGGNRAHHMAAFVLRLLTTWCPPRWKLPLALWPCSFPYCRLSHSPAAFQDIFASCCCSRLFPLQSMPAIVELHSPPNMYWMQPRLTLLATIAFGGLQRWSSRSPDLKPNGYLWDDPKHSCWEDSANPA